MLENLKDDFAIIASRYIKAFIAKHEVSFEGWVGDRIGEVAELGEMFLDFADIRFDIDERLPVGTLEEWWSYTYDLAMLECPKTINYRSWCMGAPKPYTQEQLNAIRKAHNEVAIAKRALEDLLNEN